ncbi:MAG: hypothetical protein ACYDHH_25630 [Solirubrobacteraceae bacterium]
MRFGSPRRVVGASAATAVAAALGGAVAIEASANGSPVRAGAAAVGGTPTVPTSTTSPTTTTGPVPVVSRPLKANQVIQLPSNARCVSRLKVTLTRPGGVRLTSLVVKVGSRRITRRPPPKSLTIGKPPKGKFTLAVTVTTVKSKRFSVSRRYHSCRK